MLRTAQSAETSYQRLIANDYQTFDDAIEAAVYALEQQGIQGVAGEPDITIILQHNGKLLGNDKLIDAIIYIGATKEQISNDTLNPPVE